MAFYRIEPQEWACRPVHLLAEEKMLLLSSLGEKVNGMTVSWGGFGVMWGRPIMLFAVRPNRYTYRLLEEGAEVSLASLPSAYREALAYCGTHSGEGEDKLAAAGLHAVKFPGGVTGCAEAQLFLGGRLLYAQDLSEESFLAGELPQRWYKKEPYHRLYMAEVKAVYVQKEGE